MCAFLCLPYTAIGAKMALNGHCSSLHMDSIADSVWECVYQMVDKTVDFGGRDDDNAFGQHSHFSQKSECWTPGSHHIRGQEP